MTNEMETPVQNEPPAIKKRNNWLLPLGLLVVLLIVLGIVFTRNQTGNEVARVEGEAISRQEFNTRVEQVKSIYQMQGLDVSDQETIDELEQAVLDEMINEMLMFVHATRAGISVSSDEVDSEYQQIKDNFPTEEDFKQALEDENVTESELRDNLEKRIVIRKYVEQQMSPEDRAVSDEELNDLYEQYSEELGDQLPPFEEVRDELEESIVQQRMQEAALGLIAELKEDSDIEILL